MSKRTKSSHRGTLFYRLKKNKLAMAGLLVLAVELFIVFILPMFVPFDPYTSHSGKFGAGPEAGFFLGFDESGRDLISRLIYGGRTSLLVGLAAMLLASGIGVSLGMLAGYFGGAVDMVIMRIADVLSAFPSMVFMLVFVAVFGNSVSSLILIFGLLGAPSFSRLIRGKIISVREEEYVEAAKAIGTGNAAILFQYILPNAIAPVFVQMAYSCSSSIIYESGLSFLGIGVQPPIASWGNILHSALTLTVLMSKPWIWVPTAILFMVTVLSINFLGDGLRKAVNIQ